MWSCPRGSGFLLHASTQKVGILYLWCLIGKIQVCGTTLEWSQGDRLTVISGTWNSFPDYFRWIAIEDFGCNSWLLETVTSLTPNHRPAFSPGTDTTEVCSMATGARLCETACYPSPYGFSMLQTSSKVGSLHRCFDWCCYSWTKK